MFGSRERMARWLGAATLLCGLMGPALPAMAGAGHWKYDGYTLSPTQDELSAIKAGPGHVFERRASGGFQAGDVALGTLEFAFTSDDADHAVFTGSCSVSMRIESNLVLSERGTFPASGIVQTEGNDKTKAAGGNCSGSLSIDNGDAAVRVDGVEMGTSGNGKGAVVIPTGAPGSTMTVHIGGYLLNGNGAASQTLHANFHWEAP